MSTLKTTLATVLVGTLCATAFANPLVYEGTDGLGKGLHLVFVASDHEYRSEETCPALARILARHHGFKCTVLFGLDPTGHIQAGASNVPGMEALRSADGLVIFTRFLDLPNDQMQHLADFLGRGGPVVGLRTSSHAFSIKNSESPFYRFDFRYDGDEYKNGFGEQVLGNTWVGHYGTNHQQGTRIQLVPKQKGHPILRGVGDHAFCFAGGYNGVPGPDFTVLTMSQPLVAFSRDAEPDKTKPPVVSTWTRYYTARNGEKARVFHSTQGASEDILDVDYRRMIVNGILWSVGLEDQISAELSVKLVGPYHPHPFQFGGCVRNVKPSDLAGFDTPIMPRGEKFKPGKGIPNRRGSAQ